MITKVAAGIVGIGLLGTGSVSLAKPGWFGISSQPHFTSLEEDYDYNTKKGSEYKDKFGAEHKDKLVGVYGKKENEDGNKGWWEWSFKKLQEDGVTEGNFAVKAKSDSEKNNIKVSKSYSKGNADDTDKDKALNQVCYAVYKSESTKITEAGDSAKGEYKKSDVWKYCSRFGKEPKKQANS